LNYQNVSHGQVSDCGNLYMIIGSMTKRPQWLGVMVIVFTSNQRL